MNTAFAWQSHVVRACLADLEAKGRLGDIIDLAPKILAQVAEPCLRGRIELATAEALLVTGCQALALAAFERALGLLRNEEGTEAAEVRIRALDELTAWDEPARAERLRSRLNDEIESFLKAVQPGDDTAWVWLASSRLGCERGDIVEASVAASRAAHCAHETRVRDAAQVQRVICLRQSRRFQEATKLAKEVLEDVQQPRARAELYVQLGHSLYDSEELDASEQAYLDAVDAAREDGALAEDPDFQGSVEAWLANVECDRGQLDAAEARARALVANSWRDGESHVEGLLVLARCATERHNYREARAIYQSGLACEAGRTYLRKPLSDGVAHVFYLEALAAYELDHYPEAVPLLRSAIDLADPQSATYAWAELALAYCFEAQGKTVVARSHYEAVSRAPGATSEDLAAAYEFLMQAEGGHGTA